MLVWRMSSQDIYRKIQALPADKREELFEALKKEYVKQAARERPFSERLKYWMLRFFLWLLRMGVELARIIDGLLSLVTLTWFNTKKLVSAVVFIAHLFMKERYTWNERWRATREDLPNLLSQIYATQRYKYLAWRKQLEMQLYKEQNDVYEDVARRFITD